MKELRCSSVTPTINENRSKKSKMACLSDK